MFQTTGMQPAFLSATALARWVRARGVARVMQDMACHIRADFLRWACFDKCARVAHHSRDGVIELMPIGDDTLYSFKYVNGHPKNIHQNLPTVMALGVLAEVATGRPLLVSELTLSTALRTAAMSALAAQHLARQDSRTMALIGNGAQSEFQALAFQAMLGIEHLQVFDVDAQATAKLCANLADSGLNLVVCKDARAACAGADIVTTVTADKTNATIITSEMLRPGMHLNAVGGDCPGKTELHADVLRQASVFVEYTPQSRVEGEIQQMPADFAVTELWQVLGELSPGRQSESEVTVFDSVGFALEDFAVLRYWYDQVRLHGLGEPLDILVATPNPKDLFAAVRLPASVAMQALAA